MTPAAVALNTIPVVIPALNEAATIGDVVRSLQAVGLFRICVMDHGSCDRTIEIARPAGAEGVVEPIQGYGQACWRGVLAQTVEIAHRLNLAWTALEPLCDIDRPEDLTTFLPLKSA
jgi:glycosyltransferase involved in cell wall biosynthesis